jgi:hypothetical protein
MTSIQRPIFGLGWRSLGRRFDFEPLAALPLLTLVLLLTATPDQWYLRGPLVAIFALGVVYRRWLRTPQFWYVVATLLGTTLYLNWESSDNHKYLFVYWCLALCGAFSLPRAQQQPALAVSSRWLLGLCMLLAAAWKLAMPDYRGGEFFQYTLLADERFAHFTSLAAGIPPQALADNRALRELLCAGQLRGCDVSSVLFGGGSTIPALACAMTWWTVAIEAALGIAFVLPDRRGTALLRNSLLLLFAATTYFIAPVRGFGWMLMLLGLGQCEERDRGFRPLYLAAIVLIQAYTLPVAAVIERLTN